MSYFPSLNSVYTDLQLGQLNDLPNELVPDYEKNEEFLRKVHHVLMEVHVTCVATR